MVAGLALVTLPASASRSAVLLQQTWTQLLYLAVGVGLLAVTVGDLLWATLWSNGGAGPLSSRLSRWTWRALEAVGGEDSRLLTLSGPVILTLTLVMWFGLIWGSWTLVLAGGENAIVELNAPAGITWTERLYFVGYSVFTLGNGGFAPVGGVWQIATTLMTASGMVFVTLSVSYVLSVYSAVNQKRSFAGSVTGLGSDGAAFVRKGWDSEDFNRLNLPINTLTSDLDLLTEQHKAYPILHYYHSEDPEKSAAKAVAVFDEAMTILRCGTPKDSRPNQALIESACSSVESYLRTLDSEFIEPTDEAPPSPDLDRLREADIPTVSDEEFESAIEDLAERRQHLLGMVNSDARDWPAEDTRDRASDSARTESALAHGD